MPAPGSGPSPKPLTLIFLVLSFGWSGSPGEWMPWALAAVHAHREFRPSQPELEGEERFMGWALMDDTVLVEPWLGSRPWLSARAFEWAAKGLLGKEAINQEKLEEWLDEMYLDGKRSSAPQGCARR